ncbi:DNA cytosine methyltransferase [Streptomyces scopuliridis]|uniref:DNA cytosine methyltransferase n=1 Tax=Streptomyces scopuliridis TaxID=452529 RepID=UPI003686A7BF
MHHRAPERAARPRIPSHPRIGSLCSGYGGLDIAVQDLLGGEVLWHCQYDPDDADQHAARILAHHWPHVPNYGDITRVDWSTVPPVDILTAGFPCGDVSLAGRLAGIMPGTRSGIWAHVAHAIRILHPKLVVIENVRGLLSAPATRSMGGGDGPVDDDRRTGPLRGLGAVLGDLASIGFDAEWKVHRASDAGAPHRRERVLIIAWPAA